MKNDVLLIANPVSGRGGVHTHLFTVLEELAAHGRAATVMLTGARGDATRYAAEYGAGYDTVLVMGGDGTLSEVAAGLITLSEPPKVGYIPLGTTNDVAKTFGLPHTVRECARCVMTGQPLPWDIGLFDGKAFSYIAAFGAFTESSYSTAQSLKNLLGHAAYVVDGVASLPRIVPYHTVVEHDGGRIEGDFLYGGVSNSLSVGGIVKLDPNAVSLGDGLFECILIRKPDNLADLGNIVTGILSRNYNDKDVVMLHTKKIRFTFDQPVAFTRDGESGGSFTTVEAENLHAVLRLIAPKGAEA